MNNKGKKIYIGSAWPYANGSLHLGHVSSLIGADVLARYYRQSGAKVLWTSGSDCHGTPIVVAAEQEKVEPEQIALKYHQEFKETLICGLDFTYDNYTTTLTENHAKIVQEIFLKLLEQGDIYTKTEELPYCPKCDRFLPDRYIEGTCPKCGYANARGDQCDECGSLLDATDLINPRCKVCQTKPEFRESEHFFLKLSAYQDQIAKFLEASDNWRVNAQGFTRKLLNEGLKDRAITRDTKWGIDIPVAGYESKKIYVWFEAVCGYLSASIEHSKTIGAIDFWKDFWQNDDAYHYYVHGKDNIPFHSIIWPIILLAYDDGLKLPDSILSSEYLTLEKKQFSKSRNWAVWLPDYLKTFDPSYLRYYLIANGCETSDADFSWKEFQNKVNKELIGNLANFIYRSQQLIEKNFEGKLTKPASYNDRQTKIIEKAISCFETTGLLIERGKFREALKTVLELAEIGNKFLAETEPWKFLKENPDQAKSDLFVCAELIHVIATVIKPFIPKISADIDKSTGTLSDSWEYKPIQNIQFSNSKPLIVRLEDNQIASQIAKLN
jgi:methionyl-tRNA synthetase